ncbi:hypothetical protein H0H93_006014 [Arthromyces matolae]|nr:hypothetical protein H0H93_006014 [Arthromyces matolae]
MAKCDGIPIFNALWTCMTSRYIRTQVLTLTKAHEERIGPLMGVAESAKRYGHSPPPVAYTDDPVKDTKLLCTAFPSLAKDLSPTRVSGDLEELVLPAGVDVSFLPNIDLCEKILSPLMTPLDIDPDAYLCISLDAEWNVSRRVGVSILQLAPHSDPDHIFIIPIHRFGTLPPTLLRILISDRVFKIGVSVDGDLSRLKKQFPQLSQQVNFNTIDLKKFCIDRGLIGRKDPASLAKLVEKLHGQRLVKDDNIRRSEEWELHVLSQEHLSYAALDVFASRLTFEKANHMKPLDRVNFDTPGGTRVSIRAQEGGEIVAHGIIASVQPLSLGRVRVKTSTRSRLVIDVTSMLNSSAAMILHVGSGPNTTNTKSGALTLGQLQAASQSSGTDIFQVVIPVDLLDFAQSIDHDQEHSVQSELSSDTTEPQRCINDVPLAPQINVTPDIRSDSDSDSDAALSSDDHDGQGQDPGDQEAFVEMLEAASTVNGTMPTSKGKQRATTLSSGVVAVDDIVNTLQELVMAPPDAGEITKRLKKDIFHVMHMFPLSINHGMRPAFLRALRDHILIWDPQIREIVDRTCQRVLKCSFDDMLARNPRWICERCPRYIPPPSVLVPALRHVFNVFGHALDSKTQKPLFNKIAWQKAEAVLELARQGYLSDVEGVTVYEKSGRDKYGLQKFMSLRGTNNIEGGPHGDIYRKFGAFSDYNLQAFAKHHFGVNWDYHHDLELINRSSFLLTYLSDVIDGARSYSDWLNGDLYEQSAEQFGVCPFPDALRMQLGMEPYNEQTAEKFKFKRNSNNDWLRKRQGLALPVLPPTTLTARQYFFSRIRHFATLAAENGKSKVDFTSFAHEWNQTANGKDRFYITGEVLAAYAKAWEKASNIRASQELIADGMDLISQTRSVFAAKTIPFPDFITQPDPCANMQPTQAVIDNDHPAPPSLTVELPISRSLHTQQDLYSETCSHVKSKKPRLASHFAVT